VGGLEVAKDGLHDVIERVVDFADRDAGNSKPLSFEIGSFTPVRQLVM
jgi:hypothetical protein